MSDHRKLLIGLRVLVADDEPFNLSIVTRMMKELGGADIIQCTNGAEALETFQQKTAQLAFAMLDFNMPEKNGLELLKMIRTGRTAVPREMRVLMLTGSADFGLVGAAMALDVDAFIVKPVSLQTLAGRIEKVLQQHQELRPVAHYDKVDIDSITKRLMSRKPAGTPRPKTEVKKQVAGIMTKLDSVTPGAILAEDIRGPNNELVLGKATQLSERLLRRMKELREVLNLEYIYIFPDSETKAE